MAATQAIKSGVSTLVGKIMAPARFVEAFFAHWEVTLRGWAREQRNYALPLVCFGLGAVLLFFGLGALYSWQESSGSLFADVVARVVRVCWLLASMGFLVVVVLAWRQWRTRRRARVAAH